MSTITGRGGGETAAYARAALTHLKPLDQPADPGGVSKSTVIAVVLVSLVVVFLLVTTNGKSCHYNAHFSKRLVCTDDAR